MVENLDLQEVTRLGAAAYTPKQVAFLLGLKPSIVVDWMKDDDHEFTIAYFKGLYSSELAIREATFQLARNGSSPAQTLSMKIFDETKKNLQLNGFSEEE
ncbi:MAG: hypothetical protein J0L83_14720 [Chitinophagales bacterium]|nr:hypothetical protein [Chitinophagales bacterium]